LAENIHSSVAVRVPLACISVVVIEWTFRVALSICYQDAGDYETLRKSVKKSLATKVIGVTGFIASGAGCIVVGAGWVNRCMEGSSGMANAIGIDDAVSELDIQLSEPRVSRYPPAYEVSVILDPNRFY
jgi:hypothetical protein